MRRISKKNRYIIWTGIWLVIFALIMAFLPVYYVWAVPWMLTSLIILGFLKDAFDFYNINKGMDSFFHPYFEHMPLMFILSAYCFYNLIATNDVAWVYFGVAFLADAMIDLYQDKICCLE